MYILNYPNIIKQEKYIRLFINRQKVTPTQTITFKYNEQGLRVYKDVRSNDTEFFETSYYYYDANNNLVMENRENMAMNFNTYYLRENGILYGLIFEGMLYYYVRDINGLITGIANSIRTRKMTNIPNILNTSKVRLLSFIYSLLISLATIIVIKFVIILIAISSIGNANAVKKGYDINLLNNYDDSNAKKKYIIKDFFIDYLNVLQYKDQNNSFYFKYGNNESITYVFTMNNPEEYMLLKSYISTDYDFIDILYYDSDCLESRDEITIGNYTVKEFFFNEDLLDSYIYLPHDKLFYFAYNDIDKKIVFFYYESRYDKPTENYDKLVAALEDCIYEK